MPEKFNVLQLSDSGLAALKDRQPIHLVKPIAVVKGKRVREEKRKRDYAAVLDYDQALFDRLRRLRKKLADDRSVPAYIVFSDVSLREMARYYPTTKAEFARINGVGATKLADFGQAFIDSIAGYLRKNERRHFD